jgi:phage baseplate assembly protein gpV
MATTYKVPQIDVVSSTVSVAAAETALATRVRALEADSTTIPGTIRVSNVGVIGSGTFTWTYTIFYSKYVTV